MMELVRFIGESQGHFWGTILIMGMCCVFVLCVGGAIAFARSPEK